MFIEIIILILSLVALIWSADKFVFGAAAVARNFGIAPIIIGLTIVAMGSSAPEMLVAATASINGAPNTAIGNVIGSNITNIALVLGLTALFKPLMVSSATIKREMPLLLLVTIVASWMLYDLNLSFTEGLILIIAFGIFIISLLLISLKQSKDQNNPDPMLIEAESEIPEGVSTPVAVFWLIIGMVLLPLSSHFLVDSATFIAKAFGISDLVIGLTIIAIGTSLPELAASIMSLVKKEDDLAIGNIIGSNIFNILAVLALPGLISPGAVDSQVASRDIPYMLGLTIIFLLLCFSRRIGFRITRLKGAVLFIAFIAYQYLIFSQMAA
ncbi:calcium/sodium antiporter [Thalassomonas sp. M1454]|uniref:calcium/sodium antiporter n=1 Tax=Thalassomonas sp. M1454 TaxID=2594477 RepID=UPI00117FA237|nr:calcium/sodium antiporter [Thalassomonas sp. M1454]TRX52777.1 calcium/sodium antiporter [Thalassomonas sp. M1454]